MRGFYLQRGLSTKPVIINFIYYDVNKILGVGSLKNNEHFGLQFLTGFDSGFINVELCFHLPEGSLLLGISARRPDLDPRSGTVPLFSDPLCFITFHSCPFALASTSSDVGMGPEW